MFQGECNYCSKNFSSSHKRKFCSDSCKVMYYRKINNPHQYTNRNCKTCGKLYRGTYSSKFCSKECGLITKKCLYCENSFKGHRNSKYCSMKCKDAFKVRKPTGATETCTVCRKEYAVTLGKKRNKKKVCSVICSNVFTSSKSGEFITIVQMEHLIRSSKEQLPAKMVAEILNTSHTTVISRAKEFYGSYREMIIALRGTYVMEDDKSLTANTLFTMIEDIYNVKGIKEKTFKGMVNPLTNVSLRLDYYLPSVPLAIEYHGIQHYKDVLFFNKETDSLKNRQYRDSIKEKYLANKNIPLVIFNYLDSIDEITIRAKLDFYLKSGNTEVT